MKIHLRIVQNHGRDGMISPALAESLAHAWMLVNHGFGYLDVMPDQDLRRDILAEIIYEVPVGRVIEFESLAGSFPHARIFRPN